MMRKRDIYIKVDGLNEVVDLLKSLFDEYNKLNSDESKLFENWNNYLEDIFQRMDHLTL
jgi:hypothetical protein